MTFIVESGSGTPGANAYAPVAFVTAYLTDRGRSTENGWAASTTQQKQESIVKATDYIEQRWGPRFGGYKANTAVAGRVASGAIELASLPLDGSTFTVGQRTYRMVDTLAQEGDVLIGVDITTTIANMVAAVNLDAAALDVTVEGHTQPNYDAVAVDQSPEIAIAARTEGESGNNIAFETDIVGATITGSGTLVDGVDSGEQPLSFPRRGLFTDSGIEIAGVPAKVKQATAEYAVRALAAVLSPDPTVDPRLVPVASLRTKVGPIEKETRYDTTSAVDLIKPYPAADALLASYLAVGGGAIRG